MIGKTISHYKIVEKLGEGGMGEVYLAEDTELKRKVALKFLPSRLASDSDAMARFKREAQAAAALNHPNIITVHEIGHHEDQSFIAMAYINGELLSDELQKGIPLERALDTAVQVCDGLDKAHKGGIVHRDIKPENLLTDPDGRVKILDFGLATIGHPGAPSTDESTAGTVHYMSPEQVRGDTVDARSDVFSLGAVLYELLSGKKPFKGEHAEAVRYSILHEEPELVSPSNPRVTPEMERIVAKALAKDPNDRYPSAAMFRTDIKSLSVVREIARRKMSPMRLLIPAALVLLVATLFIVVNPLKVNISSDQDAVAGENTVAIMYFENMAQHDDPQRLGEIITNLLITNLSQSQDLKVVSSQRLYDILKQQGKEGAKVIDRTTASEIARTAGARWMMLGSILQVEPHLVVTSQLVEVTTGNIESSQKLTGQRGETVFDVVDRMTGDTRKELPIPVVLDVEPPKSVATVTTNSLEAYRHYLEGKEYDRKFYDIEASRSFRQAIELDSTFAMAYYAYGWNAIGRQQYKEGIAAMDKAMTYVDRVSEKERLYIEASCDFVKQGFDKAITKLNLILDNYPDEKDAILLLALQYHIRGVNEKALDCYRKIIALDPLNKEVYNQMAYLYDSLGNFEKSIWAINQYIELVPDEANPYDSRADLYAYNGDIDNALASYQKAVEIKPEFYQSIEKIGNMYLYKGNYESAGTHYQQLAASDLPADRSKARRYPAVMALYQGRLHEALTALDDAISADERERFYDQPYLEKRHLKVRIFVDLGQFDQAYKEAGQCFGLFKQFFPMFSSVADFMTAGVYAVTDKHQQADSLLAPYEAFLDTLDEFSLERFHLSKGLLELNRDRPDAAAAHLEKVVGLNLDNFAVRYRLAESYLAGGRVDDATTLLETLLKRFDESRLNSPTLAVRGYYLLGTAYQRAARNEEAIIQFQKFLEIWKDADPELSEVPDARNRLEILKKSS
jgi:serine/threonine protein kinase/tetratricopeptide (TPR) repeat protein